MNYKIAMLVSVGLLSGCVSNEHSATQFSEQSANYVDLSSEESKDKLANYWHIEKRVNPDFPKQAAKQSISGCVDVIVGVNKNGKMGIYKVKDSYPEGLFVDKAVAALQKWRWSAVSENPNKTSVLTSVQLTFYLQGTKNKDEFVERCI